MPFQIIHWVKIMTIKILGDYLLFSLHSHTKYIVAFSRSYMTCDIQQIERKSSHENPAVFL